MVRLRRPFAGLIEETADHPSILLFVLFISHRRHSMAYRNVALGADFLRYFYPFSLGLFPAI
jgi:hypothetical protein